MRTQVPNDHRWKPKTKAALSSAPVPWEVNLPLVSPEGKASNNKGYGNDSASPVDDKTIAETPSPGGNGFFSPETLQVKILPPTNSNNNKKRHVPFDESPNKDKGTQFDETRSEVIKHDFESIWDTRDEEQNHDVDSSERNKNSEKGKKSPPHMRQLTQIMHDIFPSPARESEDNKTRMAAPLPFVSPGTSAPSNFSPTTSTNELTLLPHSPTTRAYIPTDDTLSSESSPTTQKQGSLSTISESNKKFSLSLSEQIALAQKLGMAERLACVPKSQQYLTQRLDNTSYLNKSPHEDATELSMRSSTSTPPPQVDVLQFVPSPSGTHPVQLMSMPSYIAKEEEPSKGDAADVSAIKPHSLFQSLTKNDYDNDNDNNNHNNSRNFDRIDRILSREIAAAAVDATIESELHTTFPRDSFIKMEETPEDEPGALIPKVVDANPKEEETEQEDKELPFDCAGDSDMYSTANISHMNESRSLHYLEEGMSSVERSKSVTVRKIIRNPNGTIAGITVKKGHMGASVMSPGKVMETMRSFRDQSSINPSEMMDEFEDSKSMRENFLDEPLASLKLAECGDKSFGLRSLIESPYRFPINDESPGKKKNESSSEDKKGRRSCIWTSLHICTLIVLIICGIFAGLFASGNVSFWSKEGSSTLEETPAIIGNATISPTKMESNIFEGSEIVACGNAIPITEMDRAYYGSNWKAFWDETIDTCGDQMSTGYAVWYSFTTNSSKLVEVSTCNNADFDTQITVMSGLCSEPTCISYNDQACGDQSLVTWYAEAFTTYYVMVHGYREASGTFGLTMAEVSHNDKCVDAVGLDPEAIVAGTTAGVANSLEQLPQCGDVDLSGNGVWYVVGNVTGFYRAEILLGYTDFAGQVSVYRSMDEVDLGCDALLCEKGSSTGSVMWLAEAKDTYYVYVNGKDGAAGDFDLFLGQNKASSCNLGTRIDPNSVGYLASTRPSNPQNVESCGYTGYHTAAGLWFSVEGTGDILEVSTCGSLLDLDTQISVFGNGCDSLECIGGTGQDYPCGDNGSVSWKTEIEEIYQIYVSGRSSRVGDFVLNINDVPVQDGYTCDGSLPLDLGSTSIESSTIKAPSEPVDLCYGNSSVRGFWHSFVGTGKAMRISVCNEKTDFDARVSIFTGSCDGLSCVAHTGSRCGKNDEILVTTHVGVTYYLFVHGPDSFTIGNYLLTIDVAEINDSCGSASILDLTSSAQQYFGSTLSASNSAAIGCSGSEELISESPALWYTFSGTGKVVTFSTCSYLTDFNTDVRIFSGSCSELGCVSNVENIKANADCGQRSGISFQSISDEVYYARIGGNSTNDTGNFVMEVNPTSPFFGP